MEAIAAQEFGRVFHFSKALTVTTSFLVFVFDIRREQK
jgi:hypothetical protein